MSQLADTPAAAIPQNSEWRVPFLRPLLPEFPELQRDFEAIFRSGMLTKGTYLEEFESAIAHHLGVRHAIGVSSCTSGLMLTFRTLGLTGEVIVPSFTFMASVSSLVWAGLTPVFADIDAESVTIRPSDIEPLITERTSAIVAVHTFGNPAPVDDLDSLARRHSLSLIFDAAHGFGTRYRGRPVGRNGVAEVFSLSPTKLLISGEGGIIATNDDRLAKSVIMGREYGNSGGYDSAFPGLNARMGELNAALGLKSLELLEDSAIHRNRIADCYRSRLDDLPGVGFQCVEAGDRSSRKDFSITIDPEEAGVSRDEVRTRLGAEGIETRTYFDPPVHRHLAYRRFHDGRDLPNTTRLSAQSLSLPMWSNMSEQTAAHVCEVVRASWSGA